MTSPHRKRRQKAPGFLPAFLIHDNRRLTKLGSHCLMHRQATTHWHGRSSPISQSSAMTCTGDSCPTAGTHQLPLPSSPTDTPLMTGTCISPQSGIWTSEPRLHLHGRAALAFFSARKALFFCHRSS